jgi:hypothetical protein
VSIGGFVNRVLSLPIIEILILYGSSVTKTGPVMFHLPRVTLAYSRPMF